MRNLQSKGREAVVRRVLHQAGFRMVSRGEEPDLVWSDPGPDGGLNTTLQSLPPHSRLSVCPGLDALNRKGLAPNLESFMAGISGNASAKVPFLIPRWELPVDIDMVRTAVGWVVVRDMNVHKGLDFHVFQAEDIQSIESLLEDTSGRVNPNSGRLYDWRAYEYVRPHLVDGRKWEMRVHILITGFDPLRIFIGLPELGWTRHSPVPFNFKSTEVVTHSVKIHWMNEYNLKVHGEKMSRSNRSTIKSLKEFFKEYFHVDEDLSTQSKRLGAASRNSAEGPELVRQLWANIERIVLQAVLAAEPTVRAAGRTSLDNSAQCFQILGFDFMLEAGGSPMLLGVNKLLEEHTFDAEAQAKVASIGDALCVATGFGCTLATRAPEHAQAGGAAREPVAPGCAPGAGFGAEQAPASIRPGTAPFESAVDDLAALRREVDAELQRAERYTSWKRLWPPRPEHTDLARAADQTEEWAPSLYTRALLGEDACPPSALSASIPQRKMFSPPPSDNDAGPDVPSKH